MTSIVTNPTADQTIGALSLLPTGRIAAITNISINSSNLLQVTAASHFLSGASVILKGLTSATFLNGQTVTILSASGTQFTATFVHAAYSAAPDTGYAVNTAPTQGLGNHNASWDVTVHQVNSGAVLFADQYASIQDAIAALPVAGGVIDCRSPNVNLNLEVLDSGAVPVTLLLGPYTYTLDHCTMRPNLKIYGAGWQGTFIESSNSSQSMFVLSNQGGGFFGAVLDGISFKGAAGNAQDCFHWDVSQATGLVAEYSVFSNLQFTGFHGSPINMVGSDTASSAFQFLYFYNCIALGTGLSSDAPILKMTGYGDQISFEECEFDNGGPGANIYLAANNSMTQGNTGPTAFFHNVTCQGGYVGFYIFGAGAYIDGGHFELVPTCFTVVGQGNGLAQSYRVVVRNCYFAGNCGQGGGNGSILYMTTQYGWVDFSNNTIGGVPDRVVVWSTEQAQLIYRDNVFNPNAFFTSSFVLPVFIGGTPSAAVATVLATQSWHQVYIGTGSGTITTINSGLGPGEMITFFTAVACAFATGGNISLGTKSSPLNLPAGASATFVFNAQTVKWQLVSTV
ncbi:MAG: hypothetical protein ACRD2U_09330 [Terriglobales bacterium]